MIAPAVLPVPSMVPPVGATLPSNDGYVAAAYIVFFVLLLVYVAIVAWRLARVERSVRDLRALGRGEEGNRGGDAEGAESKTGEDARAREGEGQAV